MTLTGRAALGLAGFSLREGRDRGSDVAVLRAAADAGITVFDAARAYATVDDELHSERLLADALGGRRGLVLGTKGGHFRTGASSWGVDNGPARLRRDAEASLRALGAQTLDLYYLHRADEPGTELEAAVAELARLRDEGLVRRIGLSNVTAAQFAAALAVAPIDAVQNQYGVGESSGPVPRTETEAVLRLAEREGIAFFAYSPLGGRSGKSVERFPQLAAVAASRGVSVERMLLRGLLARSPVLSVVTGASRVESVVESAAAEREPWDAAAQAAWEADGPLG